MFYVCHYNTNVDTSKRQKDKRKETKHINTKKSSNYNESKGKGCNKNNKKTNKMGKNSKMRTVSLHL